MQVTKKELEERYNLSDNTVYKTLKACGLDTSKTSYSEEEIKDRFEKARGILEAGGTYKDVEDCFSMRQAQASPEDAFDDFPTDEASVTSLRQQVSQEVLQTYDEVMDAAVRDVIPFLPMLMFKAGSKYARNGAIHQAFAEFREMLTQEEAPIIDFGAMAGPRASSAGLSGEVDEEWLAQYEAGEEAFDDEADIDTDQDDVQIEPEREE